jgi:hypothetical protein
MVARHRFRQKPSKESLFYQPIGRRQHPKISVEQPCAYSISKVYDELAGGNDELADWIKGRKNDGRFLDITDKQTQTAFTQVAAFVQNGAYKLHAKANFLAKADPWLVAKAITTGAVVVTHEKPEANSLKRVPLPNICDQFNVRYINTFDLLQRNDAAFRLAA